MIRIKTTTAFIAAFALVALASGCESTDSPTTPHDGAELYPGFDQDGGKAVQVDRMGIPALNTVFNHPSGIGPFDKKAYNVASPADDLASYFDVFALVLGVVANEDPEGTAGVLLPDALPVNMGAPTNFAMLNGRNLADDATDVALSVVIGPSLDFLHSDNVDENDRAFRSEFPYVAPPHTP